MPSVEGGEHLKLRKRIEQAPIKAASRLAGMLNTLRLLRVDADYYLKKHIYPDQAAAQIALAHELFRKIDWIEKNPPAIVEPPREEVIVSKPQFRIIK